MSNIPDNNLRCPDCLRPIGALHTFGCRGYVGTVNSRTHMVCICCEGIGMHFLKPDCVSTFEAKIACLNCIGMGFVLIQNEEVRIYG